MPSMVFLPAQFHSLLRLASTEEEEESKVGRDALTRELETTLIQTARRAAHIQFSEDPTGHRVVGLAENELVVSGSVDDDPLDRLVYSSWSFAASFFDHFIVKSSARRRMRIASAR